MKETFFSFLVGKTVEHYNSFHGSVAYFKIARVEDYENSIRVYPDRAEHWGCFIPKKYLGEILTGGTYTEYFSVDDCSCREEWRLFEF